MIRVITVLLMALGLSGLLSAQEKGSESITIAFYNTENIFDTIDDPAKTDEDFLPSARVAWTGERYHKKLQQVSRVLASIDSTNLPAIIGLAEVENLTVLEALIAQPSLSKGRYAAILEEGSDPRGIDVALIYRPGKVKYRSHKAFPSAKSFKTRNVLYVKFTLGEKDTLHVFVNHWKSRSGGASETERQRIENAETLKYLTDSILSGNPRAKILAMGDFNDEPGNMSLAESLKAEKPVKKATGNHLYNLMYDRFLNGEGTLYYKDWDLFDQIIVSGNLLTAKKGNGAAIRPPYAWIFKQDWLLYKNKEGVMVPSRTAGSREYFGGFSDHLPVYTVLGW